MQSLVTATNGTVQCPNEAVQVFRGVSCVQQHHDVITCYQVCMIYYWKRVPGMHCFLSASEMYDEQHRSS